MTNLPNFSLAIIFVYQIQYSRIKIHFQFLTLHTVNELIDMTYEIPNDAIDCACITFKLKNELIDGVPTETNHQINIEHSDIKMLLKEMKTVRSLMDEIE